MTLKTFAIALVILAATALAVWDIASRILA